MEKITLAVFLCSGLLLSGCSSNTSQKGQVEDLNSAAQYCADTVHAQSVSVGGNTDLSALPYNMQHQAVMITSSSGTTEISADAIKSVPYVTSTVLDHDEPGSAWVNCLRLKGIYFK
ncbi:hypothetical protein IBT49_27145 [Erwinia sp. S63]|uniref:hypothetical protein n=1 Tax=Erwinia sp. S63 TaxID=2769341 RepID=UPI00190A98DD|nr:hypothetical protein [Erwinia sp. S63]MBK0099672.1 hypothetical protein [Erwinia sp. S63]